MWTEFALIGLPAGYLAGFPGIGGGFIVVPAMTVLFLKDPITAPWAIHMAVATSLAVMLVTSLSSLLAHHRKGAIHWPPVRSMALGLTAGAILGAAIADFLPGAILIRIFGLLAILTGLQLILGRHRVGEKPLPGQPWASATGGFIGFISALIGIGGGAITVPWLLWHGVHPQSAVATSAACGYPDCHRRLTFFRCTGSGERSAGRNIGLCAPKCIRRKCIAWGAGRTPRCGYRTSFAARGGEAGVRPVPVLHWHTHADQHLIMGPEKPYSASAAIR